jgi:hypothetical protein
MTLQEIFNHLMAGKTAQLPQSEVEFKLFRSAITSKYSRLIKQMEDIGAPGSRDQYLKCSYDKKNKAGVFALVDSSEKQRQTKEYKVTLL